MAETWTRAAEDLLDLLPARPVNAPPNSERLEWRLRELLERFVAAATCRPYGVKKAVYRRWPRIIADVPVTRWVSQEKLADVTGVDVRSLQRWESRGLPSYGSGHTRRYPIPHAATWIAVWKADPEARDHVGRLSVNVAFARNQMWVERGFSGRR